MLEFLLRDERLSAKIVKERLNRGAHYKRGLRENGGKNSRSRRGVFNVMVRICLLNIRIIR